MKEKIKMMLIRTNNGCFISDCYATSGYDFDYHRSIIKELLYDGKSPVSTYAKNWMYITKYPDKIQRKCQYDKELDYLEDVECTIEEVLSIDNFTLPPQIHYDAVRKYDYKDAVYTITNADVKHQLIDKIIYPPVVLHNSPCKFSSKQMYDITRQYILTHIDKKVATVSSNYDFCFGIEKIIPLFEPETITYQNIFARTKRERNRIHTKIKKFNNVKIFEMTHDRENYRGYPVIPEMYADSEEELKQKVDTWLDGVIDDIQRIGFDYGE